MATTTRISEIGTVIVPVSDQDAALDFFVGTLGFEKRADVPYGEGMRWVEVAPRGARTSIALHGPPGPEQPQPGIMTNIALVTADLDADVEDLRARGVALEGEVMGGDDPVPRMIFFRDPDGNTYLLVERG